ACIDAGWHTAWWPAKWGGRGLTSIHAHIWATQLGLAGAEFTQGFGQAVLGPALHEVGELAQKQQFLSDIVADQVVWAAALWEPQDRDGPHLATQVEATARGYLLNGQKYVAASVVPPGWLLCFVRTRPGPLCQATTALLLEAGRCAQQKLDDARTLITLDHLQVEGAARLGPEHQAWDLLTQVIVNEQAMFGRAARLHTLLGDMNNLAATTDHLEPQLLADLNAAGVAVAALEAIELRLLDGPPLKADFMLQSTLRLRSSALLRELAGLRLRLDGYAAVADPEPYETDNEPLYGSRSGWGMLTGSMAFDDFDVKDRLARNLAASRMGWVERLAEWGRQT
ncbi:MAG: acyl-CoA dehydrogenase family protein, partial [Proteobacteria bacterium]|nr:acyl-CoA dehydrogenase family protein [Pseudomonadota bacterium]